jgi:hypothetical protein
MDSMGEKNLLPTLEELLKLMEEENSVYEGDRINCRESVNNGYSVYMVYSSGPCIDIHEIPS